MCTPRASASTSSGCAYSRSIRSRTRRKRAPHPPGHPGPAPAATARGRAAAAQRRACRSSLHRIHPAHRDRSPPRLVTWLKTAARARKVLLRRPGLGRVAGRTLSVQLALSVAQCQYQVARTEMGGRPSEVQALLLFEHGLREVEQVLALVVMIERDLEGVPRVHSPSIPSGS